MKKLTFTGTQSAEIVKRSLVLTLKNTSETDQKVILFDSPALSEESSQVVKAVTFGQDKSISFNDSAENAKLKELKAFASICPIHVSRISLESDSNAQVSEDILVRTPVIFEAPIVETIEPLLRKGGSDYEMPAQLFIGEGCEISFILKANTSVKVTVNVGAYEAIRLV